MGLVPVAMTADGGLLAIPVFAGDSVSHNPRPPQHNPQPPSHSLLSPFYNHHHRHSKPKKKKEPEPKVRVLLVGPGLRLRLLTPLNPLNPLNPLDLSAPVCPHRMFTSREVDNHERTCCSCLVCIILQNPVFRLVLLDVLRIQGPGHCCSLKLEFKVGPKPGSARVQGLRPKEKGFFPLCLLTL